MPIGAAFVVVFLASAGLVRLIRLAALNKALLDVPNERSSHRQPVPRLGGAAFIPLVLIAGGILALRLGRLEVIFGFFLGGALALFFVSLADDVFSLAASSRLAFQFLVAGGLLGAAVYANRAGTIDVIGSLLPPDMGRGAICRYLPVSLVCLALWIVGIINIFNFMDGIDGIAGVQAVVAGIAWFIIGTRLSAPIVATFSACVAAGVLGFLTLNWPPAKIFMGDAGSTVLGFIFATVPFVTIAEANSAVRFESLLVASALVVWPFLADGSFTILRRLKNRENILRAHRSHLYQRLVTAGKSHRLISSTYGGLAVFGAVLACFVVVPVEREMLARITIGALASTGVLFFALWRWTVVSERGGGGKV